MEIIADFNTQYGTNHDINNFDIYYQDIQSRIKNQKYSNKDYVQKQNRHYHSGRYVAHRVR